MEVTAWLAANLTTMRAQEVLNKCVDTMDSFPSINELRRAAEGNAAANEDDFMKLDTKLECGACGGNGLVEMRNHLNHTAFFSCEKCANGLEQQRYANTQWQNKMKKFQMGLLRNPPDNMLIPASIAYDKLGWNFVKDIALRLPLEEFREQEQLEKSQWR